MAKVSAIALPPSRHLSRAMTRVLMAAGGLALVLAGVGMLANLLIAIYGETPEADRLAVQLGLGGASLLPCLSQIALLAGSWLVWRSVRRQR
jgi:hypothetical protein